MRQLTCIVPEASMAQEDTRIFGALHPPVMAGRANGGQVLVVLPVPEGFDETALSPGWRVLERLKDDGLFAGFRANAAELAPLTPEAGMPLANFSWIPIPMGW